MSHALDVALGAKFAHILGAAGQGAAAPPASPPLIGGGKEETEGTATTAVTLPCAAGVALLAACAGAALCRAFMPR